MMAALVPAAGSQGAPAGAVPSGVAMQPEAQEALSADIHRLGDLLGEAIRRLAGEEAFDWSRRSATAAKGLRADPSVEEARRLRDRLGRARPARAADPDPRRSASTST